MSIPARNIRRYFSGSDSNYEKSDTPTDVTKSLVPNATNISETTSRASRPILNTEVEIHDCVESKNNNCARKLNSMKFKEEHHIVIVIFKNHSSKRLVCDQSIVPHQYLQRDKVFGIKTDRKVLYDFVGEI
ncbi:hypothetical protein L6452_40513 [Arctium lappa]|uniref:Uncharacterized protein n=1 Tax=Arctium lappa TaxID=4217 RepID=A0ACB8XMH1_ARCLA|nr:hypothetical protein L6452_40513 [Arctium lappa]